MCECMYVMYVTYVCMYVWNISHGPVVTTVTAADSRWEPNVETVVLIRLGVRMWPRIVSCRTRNEPSGSIKGGEFVDQPNDC